MVNDLFGPSSSASVSMSTDLISLFDDDGVLLYCSRVSGHLRMLVCERGRERER